MCCTTKIIVTARLISKETEKNKTMPEFESYPFPIPPHQTFSNQIETETTKTDYIPSAESRRRTTLAFLEPPKRYQKGSSLWLDLQASKKHHEEPQFHQDQASR